MMKKYIFPSLLLFSFTSFISSSPVDNTTIINTLFGRDKSPNPAIESYCGCNLISPLDCSSHTNSDIQMGECWSNARVMHQRSAFFTPFPPGHKSYHSEGGPYGSCTAYSCYPNEQDMQVEKNLANFCFFWDGKVHTGEVGGGILVKRSEGEEQETGLGYGIESGAGTSTGIEIGNDEPNLAHRKHFRNSTDSNPSEDIDQRSLQERQDDLSVSLGSGGSGVQIGGGGENHHKNKTLTNSKPKKIKKTKDGEHSNKHSKNATNSTPPDMAQQGVDGNTSSFDPPNDNIAITPPTPQQNDNQTSTDNTTSTSSPPSTSDDQQQNSDASNTTSVSTAPINSDPLTPKNSTTNDPNTTLQTADDSGTNNSTTTTTDAGTGSFSNDTMLANAIPQSSNPSTKPSSGGKSSKKKKTKKGKKGKKGKKQPPSNPTTTPTTESIPKAPGQLVIPMPMICPSNLENCYSQTYFEPGGKLENYALLKPTYPGLWFPPKNRANHQFLFCFGLGLGCSTPTMRDLQLHRIADQHCNVAQCKPPSEPIK